LTSKITELPIDEENRIHKLYETLKETLQAVSMIKYSEKKAKEIVGLFDKLIAFDVKIDVLKYIEQTNPFIQSTFPYDKMVCKKTLNTIHKKQINGVVFFHEETLLAVYSDENNILIYNVKSGDLMNTLVGHTAPVLKAIKLKDGSLASASTDKKIKVWNPFKATCERTLSGHTAAVGALIEFPNLVLVSGSLDKTISFWDLKEKESHSGLIRTFKADNQGRVMALALITNEELAATSEYNINLYNMATEKVTKTLTGHDNLVRDIMIYDHASYILISSSDDKTVRVWNWNKGVSLKTFSNYSICHKLIKFNKEIFCISKRRWNLKVLGY